MERIPASVVEATWEHMAGLSPAEAPHLIHRFEEAQPAVLSYLMAADEEDLNQDERDLLLYIALTVWQIMSQNAAEPPLVTIQMLEAAEERNIAWLESLERKAMAGQDDAGLAMVQEYHQPDILQGVLEALMGSEEDAPQDTIRDENKGLLLLSLKTVIDCLDA